MAEETVEQILARWNKPTTDDGIARLVGVTPPEGDTRATAHIRDERLDHDRNPANDSVDAARMDNPFVDDGDDDDDADVVDERVPYADRSNDELRAELESRGLSKSGNKDELVARLEADDEE